MKWRVFVKPSHARTMIAGIAGGFAMNLAMLLTFRFIGFGVSGEGILLNPEIQSEKLITVWTQIEPLPLVVEHPAPIIIGIIIFGLLHAYVYRSVASAWPQGRTHRGLRFSLLVFIMVFLFWEFFTPFNQLGEPPSLIAIELVFWGTIALAEGLAIAFIMEPKGAN